MLKRLCTLSLLCLSFSAYGQDLTKLTQADSTQDVVVDLREPLYEDGVLTTEKGGVITAPDLRIQALHICYTRKLVDNTPVFTIEAEDDVIVEFGEYVFVGQKVVYNFQTKEGTIYRGKTQIGPWYFGGERIELRADGSYIVYDGYVTTSENAQPEWAIFSSEARIFCDHYIEARKVKLQIYNFTILWVPSIKTYLDSIFDAPIRYRFKWGGRQGPRFGLTYEIFAWDNWKTFLRFDYRFTRGPGGGIETHYHSPDYKTEFQSINYITQDASLLDFHKKLRYRFEGIFRKLMDGDKLSILFTYDKVSDLDMPSSYYDNDFDFKTSERTQLLIRRQEEDWIGNFYARVRVNNFQTVKQELPSFGVNIRPFNLGYSGVIVDNWAKASYLDFKYADNLRHVEDYSSTRWEYRPRLYRPYLLGPAVTLTPELGGVTILYGNSPEHDAELLALGKAGFDLHIDLYRYYGRTKHIIEPYASYSYYTSPTSSPNEHYIFDIDDGWYRLNILTMGLRNFLYGKSGNCLSRLVYADLYTHAFFDNPHIHPLIPRLYGRLVMLLSSTLRSTFDTAWDFRHRQLGYCNVRLDWTLDDDFAISTEYRHRNAFTWRKVDPENFFLDSFRSEEELRHSPLSDRRDTLLLHLFYRFHPNWVCEVSTRHGWNRFREPPYTEYEVDLITTIQTAWHVTFSLQHRENDTRFAIYVNIGLKQPEVDCCPSSACYYE